MAVSSSEKIAEQLAELALDRKALDVVVVDVRGKASYADFLVLASGTSDRHVQAIADFADKEMAKEHGVKSQGQEGVREGQWALVDFGSVILHVFHQFTRTVFDLDGLWAQAPKISVSDQPKARAESQRT